jgi:hypothetical protein
MRTALIAVCLIASAGMAWAQSEPDKNQAYKSQYSTGRTTTPETKGQKQPQGDTGPIETTTGGAPASSAQGDTPAGMQAAPDGSSKTVVAPDKN